MLVCEVILGRTVKRRSLKDSATGTRTRVARVRAEYPNQLDYSGAEKKAAAQLYSDSKREQTSSAVPTRSWSRPARPCHPRACYGIGSQRSAHWRAREAREGTKNVSADHDFFTYDLARRLALFC